jgi:HEAT repeat protein
VAFFKNQKIRVMKNFLERILSRFSNNEPVKRTQRAASKMTVYTPSTETIVKGLIEQLSFIHSNKELQVEKRLDTFKGLAAMKGKAKSAIPALIGKYFPFDLQEVPWAKETLEAIDTQWYLDDLAKGEIPFLIKKLGKDQPIAYRAIGILKLIGRDAETAVIKELEGNNDAYFQINAIKFLGEIKPPNIATLPILNKIITQSENANLLNAAIKLLGNFNEIEEGIVSNLTVLLKNKSYTVRASAVNTIHNLGIVNENIVAVLLTCLSDDYPEVRENSIAVLSKTEHPLANEFYQNVLACRGKLSENELNEVYSKITFWTNDRVPGMVVNVNNYWDNLAWYNLELRNQLAKPELLLISVLKVLSNKKQKFPEWANTIIGIGKETQNDQILTFVIKILEHDETNKDDILTFLITRLNAPSKTVREVNIAALNNLDSNWLHREETLVAINGIIDQLDSSNRKTNVESLLQLGDAVAPFLIQRLKETEKRTIQEAIIDALNNSGDTVKTHLPTLMALKTKFSNAHTLAAINNLIEKLEK